MMPRRPGSPKPLVARSAAFFTRVLRKVLPMPVTTADALRQLHRIHRQRKDLKDRLERGPRQVRGGQANVHRLQEQVAAARQTLTKVKMATDDKELQLKEREAKIEHLRSQLNTCGSNREYQALKDQIAADEQANSVLSDEILEGYDKIEGLEAEVHAEVAELEKAEAELAKTEKRVDAEKWNLESELERVERELAQAETALPSEFRQDYLRMAKVNGEDALAAVESEVCQGCNQIITPQMYDQLLCDKLVFCKSCGRLLYLPEKTSVAD